MNDLMAAVNGAQRVQAVQRAAELLKALGAGGGPATGSSSPTAAA